MENGQHDNTRTREKIVSTLAPVQYVPKTKPNAAVGRKSSLRGVQNEYESNEITHDLDEMRDNPLD